MRKISILIVLLLTSFSASADTVKILKSQVKPTFVSDVTKYAQEMAEWKAHMARVEADAAAKVPKDRAYAPYPAPVADQAVMSAVGTDGKPNYEIVDDTPTPDQVLAQKKQNLITTVRLAEQAAISVIVPMGKTRIFGKRYNAIIVADQARRDALYAAQPVGALSSIGIGAKKDMGKAESDSIAQRPPEDAKFMADFLTRNAKIKSIEDAAAQMESDIEDLTSSNIDSWVMPAFPN